MALVEQLLFVYAVRELGASYSLCGYSVAVNVLLELPIFFCGSWLLTHVGHDRMMMCAMVAYTIRVYGYTVLQPSTVTYLLGLETMHGLTVALTITASTDYMKLIVPLEWLTTGQMLLSSVNSSAGRVIGCSFGGWFIQYGSFLGRTRCAIFTPPLSHMRAIQL